MPTKYFDKNGKEVQAFTQEDLDKAIEEAVSKAIDNTNAERQADIDNLEQELSSLKENGVNKGGNLIKQRKVIRGKNDQINQLQQEVQKMQETITKFTSDQGLDSKIRAIVGDDLEMVKKTKDFYQSFKGEPEDNEQMNTRIQNAWKLAGGGQRSISNDVIGSGQGNPPQPGAVESNQVNIDGKKLPSEAVEMAKKMGLTDQELAEHNLT